MSIETVDADRLPQKSRWAHLAVASAMALCVAHLMIINLSEGLPLRSAGKTDWPSRVMSGHFADVDEIFRRAAAGRNLQLVIESPTRTDPSTQDLFTQLYFRGVYSLLPKRVFVGRDDRVINDWAQLSAAAVDAGRDFASTHEVGNVLILSAQPGGVMSLHVRPAN